MRISEKMKQQWTNSSIGGINAFTVNADSGGDSLLSQTAQQRNQSNVSTIISNGQTDLFNSCGNYQANGTSAQSGTSTSGFQTNARAIMQSRQSLNKEINALFKQAGVQLDSQTKLTFNVGSDGKISVAGAKDAASKAKIEAALNSKTNLGVALTNQNVAIQLLNNKSVSQLQYDKWEVANFLQSRTGQSMKDLKLVDGKLTGANEKLGQLIENVGKSGGEDAKTVKEMLGTLQKVLAYGQDKIPDMKVAYDYQGGALIDKNVEYGFGPNQLKNWYAQAQVGGSASSYRG